jgi:hypothetical protein
MSDMSPTTGSTSSMMARRHEGPGGATAGGQPGQDAEHSTKVDATAAVVLAP